MRERLEGLQREVLKEINPVRCLLSNGVNVLDTEERIQEIKTKYLGRKGLLTSLFREMANLPPEERRVVGREANQLKDLLEREIERALARIKEESRRDLLQKRIDVTLPGRRFPLGKIHPITLVTQEVIKIFSHLGFEVAQGPEVESDYYNFQALNMPKEHPAREMQATFYLSEDFLLRTHTSPVQIRVMETRSPPVRIIAPGKVYRCDSDISHTPMFHQVEGLMVDKGISFGNLKGILTVFLKEIFEKDIPVRFRPSFFPFTEPSAEVDILCMLCQGRGCRVCGGSGFLEILGSGMVHPEVFRRVGYDPEEVTGFAFGMGIERICMLKYGIEDIRIFFENDLRFLQQF